MSGIRLLERVRNAIRVRQYSLATEKAYSGWIVRFIMFHHKRHPVEMAKSEVEAFLSHLAVKRKVSPSTQNQALQAILFLYRHVLEIDLPWLGDVIRAKPKRRVPVVLSKREIHLLLENVAAAQRLPASLMYGAGLRVAAGKARINMRVTCHTLRHSLPPTYWSQVLIYGLFSNCWGTMI